MVEINNATKQVAISVSPNSSLRVIKGKRSIPIRVFTENAPFESLIVRLTLSDQSLISKVKFSQPTLSFVPDRNQRYFTIEVSDTFDLEVDSASLAVVFSLEGTNAASYKSISDLSFTIENTTEVTEVESPTLTVGDATISSASLNISTVQRGIVYR